MKKEQSLFYFDEGEEATYVGIVYPTEVVAKKNFLGYQQFDHNLETTLKIVKVEKGNRMLIGALLESSDCYYDYYLTKHFIMPVGIVGNLIKYFEAIK